MKQMKNYLFILVAIVATFAACTDEYSETDPQEEQLEENIFDPTEEQALDNIPIDSTLQFEIDSREGKVNILTQQIYLSTEEWYGWYVPVNKLEEYNYYIEVINVSGKACAYTWGNDGNWIKMDSDCYGSTREAILQKKDLTSGIHKTYLYTYGQSTGYITAKIYRENKNTSGNNNGGNNSNYSITGYQANPNNGIVNETYFDFRVYVAGGDFNSMSATVDFLAPNGYLYPVTMIKKNGYFQLGRTLSQVGTYSYRYTVKSGSQTKQSSNYSLNIQGHQGSNYGSSCMISRYSNCSYATNKNAFFASNASLKGQCTWYSYGRVIELVEKSNLPQQVKNKMVDAFWGKSDRHAKNWPSMMGGSWTNTNSYALPESKRKQGMLAVWIFGEHGHVGFVEEISADKKKYRLTDFNRAEDLKKRDEWYSFTGTSDKVGGVYPYFLDLNQY